MAITIDGTGSITGLSAGGLPDASVTANDLASNAVTTAKIADANITAAKLDGAQSGSAPIYGARAWVNFNGTSTVAIRASGNVSSITDNGTGDYTVNFTTALADANYSVSVVGSPATASSARLFFQAFTNATGTSSVAPSATAFRLAAFNNATSTNYDPDYVCVAIFR